MSTKLDTEFDTEHEEGSKFDPLPAGKYNADLMDISVVYFKSGKGQGVKCAWAVWDGDYEGRYVFDQIIIQHESLKAQEIGRRRFKDLVVACGITSPIDDVSVLKDKRCTLRVKIESSDEYGDQNRVTRISPFVSASAGNGKDTAKDTAKATVRDASTTPSSGKPEDVPFDDDVPY